jgi:2-(1,2-epoxy-1,2-dihydrophenyl)acetyl-CoA isomerase
MEFSYIKFEITNSTAVITLNREKVLNSFNRQMAFEMQDALKHCRDNDDVRAILITGEGKAFSAGQDLAEATNDEFDVKTTVLEHYNPVVTLIREIEKPVVCAVNGVAAGAGANIALACDITFASENAKFIQAFSAIGLIPDSGGTYILPRLVGMQRATAMTFLGEKISAEEAERIGLIYKCVPHEELLETARKTAEKLAAMPTYGLGLTKKLLNASFDNSLESQLDLEAEMQAKAGNSDDYTEGVNAFLEKRKPNFTGK